MSPLEQRGLLYRQVAGLVRSGLGQAQAIELACTALPAGALREEANEALAALRAGRAQGREAGLGGLTGSVEQLERAASAVEARLGADSALGATRGLLQVSVALPLVVAALWGWILPEFPSLAESPSPVAGLLLAVCAAARFVGLPLALAAIVGLGRAELTFAPGAAEGQRAAALLDAAAGGGAVEEARLPPVERRYFLQRRAVVGEGQAAQELAAELLAEGRRSLDLVRALAPVGGAILSFLVVTGVLALVAQPLFWSLALLDDAG